MRATDKVTLIVCALLLVCVLAFCDAKAQDEAEWRKLQHIQATEMCAEIKQPPKILLQAIEQSVKQDERTWTPAAIWMQKLLASLDKRGCGDA